MTWSSSDIRKDIRTAIGYSKHISGMDVSTVSVYTEYNEYVYLPMFLPSESRTSDLPKFPYIEMNLMTSPTKPASIDGEVRNMDVYLDFNIYYVKTDLINPDVFGKLVADEIIDKITTYRCSIPNSYFVEIINDGREILEVKEGKIVVFHRVVECHIKNWS